MKRNLFLLLAIVVTSFNNIFAQVAPGFNVFTIDSRFDVKSEEYFRNNGFTVNNLDIMTQPTFLRDGDVYNYDPAKVKLFLERNFPDVYGTGWLVLDWEQGPYHDLMDYPATDSRFKSAEAKMLSLVSEVRKYRPNLKLSIYGLPFPVYSDWQINNYNVNGKLDNIISKLDFVAPSIYIVYAEEEKGRERIYKYLRDNLNIGLEYAKRHNKPYTPFLWHRIHPFTSPLYSSEIIQRDRFVSYVKYVKDYSYNNYKASGIFWWDDLSNRLKKLGGINGWLNGTVYDAATYDAMLVGFGKAIKQALNDGESAPSPTAQNVVSFTLYNSDTKQQIQTLVSGATLDLSTLPTKNFNIRANTNPATVGSVVFSLSGSASKSVTESQPAYDLMGDNGAWVPSTGSYTLKATPYTASKGTGTAGTALSINFNVVNSGGGSTTGSRGESFTLVNADTDRDIMKVANGANLNLSSLPTKNLNIRFDKGTISLASVKLYLSGAQSKTATESTAPYSLYGNASNGGYYSWTPSTGNYTLKATPYSGSKGTGTAGTSYSINFTVSNSLTTSSSSNLSADSVNLTFKSIDGIVVYPNPASNVIKIEASDAGKGIAAINIYDLNGKKLINQEEKVVENGFKTVMDISTLRQGLYILEVITQKGRSSQRIVVE